MKNNKGTHYYSLLTYSRSPLCEEKIIIGMVSFFPNTGEMIFSSLMRRNKLKRLYKNFDEKFYLELLNGIRDFFHVNEFMPNESKEFFIEILNKILPSEADQGYHFDEVKSALAYTGDYLKIVEDYVKLYKETLK